MSPYRTPSPPPKDDGYSFRFAFERSLKRNRTYVFRALVAMVMTLVLADTFIAWWPQRPNLAVLLLWACSWRAAATLRGVRTWLVKEKRDRLHRLRKIRNGCRKWASHGVLCFQASLGTECYCCHVRGE